MSDRIMLREAIISANSSSKKEAPAIFSRKYAELLEMGKGKEKYERQCAIRYLFYLKEKSEMTLELCNRIYAEKESEEKGEAAKKSIFQSDKEGLILALLGKWKKGLDEIASLTFDSAKKMMFGLPLFDAPAVFGLSHSAPVIEAFSQLVAPHSIIFLSEGKPAKVMLKEGNVVSQIGSFDIRQIKESEIPPKKRKDARGGIPLPLVAVDVNEQGEAVYTTASLRATLYGTRIYGISEENIATPESSVAKLYASCGHNFWATLQMAQYLLMNEYGFEREQVMLAARNPEAYSALLRPATAAEWKGYEEGYEMSIDLRIWFGHSIHDYYAYLALTIPEKKPHLIVGSLRQGEKEVKFLK